MTKVLEDVFRYVGRLIEEVESGAYPRSLLDARRAVAALWKDVEKTSRKGGGGDEPL